MTREQDILIELLKTFQTELLIAAAALAAFVVVGIPLFKRWKKRRENAREIKTLKEDLMVTERLENLVRGGMAAEDAKGRVAHQKGLVRSLFEKGLAALKENSHLPRSIPWFVIVGEPDSGKSTLLENSELELSPTTDEANEVLADGTVRKTSLPVRFWLGARAVVVDVSGRVFFDRWAGTSSAEWSTIVRLIKSKHRAKPLTGIILTIPADALLADEKSLERRKVQLAASELERLTAGVAMHLPCYVVVTKLDLLTGFRETFDELDESARRRAFCWTPQTRLEGRRPVFDEKGFDEFWTATLERLRSSRRALMLSRSIFDAAGTGAARSNAASALYLFPEKFDQLRKGLENYLKTLFGSADQFGVRRLRLAGLSFTSACDKGERIDSKFAAMQGKSADQAVMREKRPWTDRPFFVHDLLSVRVFAAPDHARFTSAERMRRHVPHYVCVALLLAAAGLWGWSGLMETERVKNALAADTALLEQIADLFDSRQLERSPLIVSDESGRVRLAFEEPMGGMINMSRLSFFVQTRERLYAAKDVPLGMRAAELLHYRFSPDYGQDDKHYIFNRIQTEMAWLPAIEASARKLAASPDEPLTQTKRDAIAKYLNVGLYWQQAGWKTHDSNTVYDEESMPALLSYLFPGIQQDTRHILGTFDPRNDRDVDVMNSEISMSPVYAAGLKGAMTGIMHSWEALSAYPDSEWSLMRESLCAGELFSSGLAEMKKAFAVSDLSAEALQKKADRWREYVADLRKASDSITPAQVQILRRMALAAEQEEQEKSKEAEAAETERKDMPPAALAIFEEAAASFKTKLEDDFTLISSFAQAWSGTAAGSAELSSQDEMMLAKKNALVRFDLEQKKMREFLADVIQSGAFRPVTSSETEISYVAAMFEKTIFSDPLPEFGRPQDAVSNLRMLLSDEAARRADIISMRDAVQNNSTIKLASDLALRVLAISRMDRTLDIARAFAALYPQSKTDVGTSARISTSVAKGGFALPEGTLFVPSEASKILKTRVEERAEYSPSALSNLINPFAEFIGLVRGMEISDATKSDNAAEQETSKKSAKALSIRMLEESESFASLSRAMMLYARGFVRYWGEYADRLQPNFASWSDYRQFAADGGAYQINTMLLNAYELSYDLACTVSTEVLGEQGATDQKAVCANIEAERKALSLQFSETCARTMASVALLSSDALDASREAQGETRTQGELQLKDVSGAVPWWSRYASAGGDLLERDAALAGSKKLAAAQSEMKRFPLIREVPSSKESGLTLSALSKAVQLLDSLRLGQTVSGNEKGAANSSAVYCKDDAACKAIENWAKTVRTVAGLLSDPSASLRWTVKIPDAAKRAELAKSSGAAGRRLPDAAMRYRYLNAYVDGHAAGMRSSAVAGSSSEVILDGRANASEIVIDFYSFSDSTKPDASLSFAGSWAALRLYLHPDGVLDADKKTVWVPVALEDAMGDRSRYFIGIGFDLDLPKPSEWPTAAAWPAL